MLTFKKKERLCKKSAIDELFNSGNEFFIYPFKIIWAEINEDRKFPVQVLINVSKRNFKKAVNRNYIKRIVREAYRKNKIPIHEELNVKQKKINFAILYTAKEILSYQEIEEKINQVLKRLLIESSTNN